MSDKLLHDIATIIDDLESCGANSSLEWMTIQVEKVLSRLRERVEPAIKAQAESESRRYKPLNSHSRDALCVSLYHAGATEAEVIDALVKDRARMIDEFAQYKMTCAAPVVYRIVEDPK